MRYSYQNELNEMKLFYKDDSIYFEDSKNKNLKLIELLLKYGKIKDLIKEIESQRET